MKSPAKLKSRRYESDIQREVCRYITAQYPSVVFYAIPNGGKMNRITGAIRKATGTTAGIPDLCIATPQLGYGALYIELKNGTANKPTPDQEMQMARLRNAGNAAIVCHSFDEAKKVIDNYLTGKGGTV